MEKNSTLFNSGIAVFKRFCAFWFAIIAMCVMGANSFGQTVLTNPGSPWVVPAGVTSITVYVYGAGGAGGSTKAAVGDYSGAGGGGGGAISTANYTVVPGQQCTYVLGTGGLAAATGNNPGGNGGTTTFTYVPTGVMCTAQGGFGGSGAGNNGSAAGGAGGSTGTGILFAGGTGATGFGGAATAATHYGGGGGGAGGSSSSGSTATTNAGAAGGVGTYPGGNGATGLVGIALGTGATGGNYGGGGSGATSGNGTNAAGGAGAGGAVVITYTLGPPTITAFAPTPSVCTGAIETITGTNFSNASAVTLNGTSVGAFTIVSSTSITFTVPAAATSGLIAVTNPSGTGTSASSLTVNVTPTAPTISITPASPVCINTAGLNYQVTNTGLTYAWTVSGAGWAATAGSATPSLTATSGTVNGTIAVTGSTAFCTSAPASVLTAIVPVPAQPSAITGAASPCQLSTQTYSVTNVAGVTYTWAVPATWTINSGNGTNSINVTAGSVSGNITVTPSNGAPCNNNGTPQTLPVTPNSATLTLGNPIPPPGNIIIGSNNVVIYGFTLTPNACLPTYNFTAVTIFSGGTAGGTDLSNFQLVYDVNADGLYEPATDVIVGGAAQPFAGTFNFTVTGQTGLTTATNYLLIANVSSGAIVGDTYAATVNSTGITAGGATITGGATGHVQTIEGAVTITAMQPAAASLLQNTTNNPIAAYQVVDNGGAFTPTSFKFTTAGTYTAATDFINFKLWQSNSSTFSTGTATQLQSIAAPASGSVLTFTTGFTPFSSGATYYFYITTDVASSGINGDNVNIATDALSNFAFSSAVVVNGTNPTTVGNAQTIQGALVTITQAHPAAGTLNQNTTSNPIAAYQVAVSNFAVTPTSFVFTTAGTYSNVTDITNLELYVNSTNSTTGWTLLQTVAAPATGGTVTFNTGFTSLPVGTVYFFVAADVGCANAKTINIAAGTANFANFNFNTTANPTYYVTKTGPTNPVPAGNTQTIATPIVTIVTAHPGAGSLTQNTTSNVIASYAMTAGTAAVIPTSFKFNTGGTYTTTTDFTNFKLYVNDNNNTSSPIQVLTNANADPASGGQILFNSFTAASTIPAGTTLYFVITADVPATGISGDNVNIIADPVANLIFASASGGCSVTTSPAAGNLGAGNTQTISGPSVAISTAHPAAANISVSSLNNIIAVYQLDVTNAVSVTPTSLTLTTAGTYVATDLSNFEIWENTNATLSGATPVQTISTIPASGGALTFNSGFTAIPSAVTTYLIVTTSVAGAAVINHTVDFTSTAFTNFSFTSSTGGAVATTGTNPAAASNVQTIVGPGVAITTAHPTAGNVLVGSLNNLLASYKLSVTNLAATPTGVTLVTNGTYLGANDITNFYLYQNTVNSLSGATLIGTIAATGVTSGQTLLFNTGPFTKINAGATSYLLISADIAGGATPNDIVFISATTGATSFTFNTSATVTGVLAQSNNQKIVPLLDVYWSGATAPQTWNTANTNWAQVSGGPYNTSVWISDGNAHLEGIANTISVAQAETAAEILNPAVASYILTSSGAGNIISLATPSTVSIGTGTTYAGTTAATASANPIFGGINGLSKTGAGELEVGSAFATTFAGPLSATAGTLTLGTKGFNNSDPKSFLPTTGNDLVLNNSTFTIAAQEGVNYVDGTGYPQGFGCLQNLTSIASTGNSTIGLYKTRATTYVGAYVDLYPFMGVVPTIDAPTATFPAGATESDLTPLKVSGTLNVSNGGSALTTGVIAPDDVYTTFYYTNYIAFGGTSLTGNTTFQAYSSGSAAAYGVGSMINMDFGGVGCYLNNVTTVASQPINDSGFTMTFLGNGSASCDGGEVSLNAASSTMSGNWTVGDAAGTNAAWLLTNTGTCLTLGTMTVNNYSKAALHSVSLTNTNVTYAPSTIYLYGVGPATTGTFAGTPYNTQWFYPGALDLFNYGTDVGYGATAATNITVSFPSKLVLNTTPATNLCGISTQVAGDPAEFVGTANFQLNGTLSGTGGIQKSWFGTLTLNAQNLSGFFNTYADTTEVKGGILTVTSGSNLGTGPVVMYEDSCYFAFSDLKGFNTVLNLYNPSQTIASLSSYYGNKGKTYSQTVNLWGCTLYDNQNTNTTYGNGTIPSLTALIAGTGNFIKMGTGTLTLTGPNTYTGMTQVKAGTLALSRIGGTTLPITNTVDILGGTLSVTTTQTLKNVTLSTGTLNIASGVTLTITGSFTLVNGSITGGGTLAYSNGTLIYAGSGQQTVNNVNNPVEWPAASVPTNVTFDNFTYTGFTTGGVKLIAGKTVAGTATVNGWLDFAGNSITGAGAFTLNGLTSKSYTGNVTSGSAFITTLSSINNIYAGMIVTGAGIPAGTYIIYIDTVLKAQTLYLNNTATATGTTVALVLSTRGGVKISMPSGLGNGTATSHVQLTGTKTYNSGAAYVFNTPTSGTQIYPGFPTTPATATYSPAWDVKINVGTPTTTNYYNMTMAASGVGSSIEVSDSLILNAGVWATNTGLVTWDNPGSSYLVVPQPTWVANNTAYTNSFIATCDNTGTPISVAGPTTPFPATSGLKIKGVGNVDTYFPVGASFTPAISAGWVPSPNRMMINNNYPVAEDFTVVVNYGDIGYTPGGAAPAANRVNRIWYISSSDTAAIHHAATMKLFYTKRDWSGANWNWPTWPAGTENEIESGFDYSAGALVQKDYGSGSGDFINLSQGSDIITSFLNNVTYPYGTEVYGQYTFNVSNNNSNGIQQFNRFSVVNPTGIILPVKIINFRAYQQGSGVQTSWTCLNEVNMDHYEVERSADAVNFTTLGSVAALDNGQPSVNYGFFDRQPLQGNNYYRIKAVGKDGGITYTNIEVVVIGGGASSISIYPNPVTNHTFVLQMTNIPAGKYTLEIYNTLGQLMLNQEINHTGGSASQTIQMPSGTARGEYHVKLLGTAMEMNKMITVE